MILQWKSSLSGKETRIFRGKVIAGLLKKSIWKDDGYGELNGHMLRFETKGFLHRTTRILDIEGKVELGKIEYKTWKSTAVVTFESESYEWKFDSWVRKKWQISNGANSAVFSKTSLWKSEGEIETEDISPAMILTGLFIYGYFWKIAAAS
ncbi:hypothetical protein [Dyadobacter sp. 3J3]|uniref:hypothetical protein n=1 Tax=Dyadobacter sp. 3J3 TaxID=2606600 RepID=UPI0013594C6D|nr:hypothetical protein [Dyadobacter sp. 3J3]